MQLITADFETYYAKDYTLSKLSTEEYIRDERFEAIGVSVKINGGPGEWFSGTHGEIHDFLRQFDWNDAVMVAHNNLFDAAILSWRFGLRPKKLACTLAMARAIVGIEVGLSLAALCEYYGIGKKGDEVIHALGKRRADFTPEELARYGAYCVNDGDLCYGLFKHLSDGFPVTELELISLTLKMFSEPSLLLNTDLLKTHLAGVQERKQDLMNKLTVERADLMSNPKLATILEGLGVPVPTKPSPSNPEKRTFAFAKTDSEFTGLQEHPNEAVQAIVAARLGVKSTLEETRTQRFIEIGARGTLPVPLRYYGARTGRWSGEDKINLQNLTRDSGLKEAICAPPGMVFIDADSSQIEARVLAWLAGQDDLVEIFEQNNIEIANGVPKHEMKHDPYRVMASQIYGVPVHLVTPEMRFMGKTVILGCGYGMGAVRFHEQLKAKGVELSTTECADIIKVYRTTFPYIPELWREADKAIAAMAQQYAAPLGKHGVVHANLMGIYLPNGMALKYPNLRQVPVPTGKEFVYDMKVGRGTPVKVKLYGAKAIENVCQALARIIIGDQMLDIAKRLKVVMTVHDAVGCLAPEQYGPQARAYVEACMRKRPTWGPTLPLNCESKMGKTYG